MADVTMLRQQTSLALVIKAGVADAGTLKPVRRGGFRDGRHATRGEYAMQIVDAQIHVWGSGLPSNLAHRQVTAFTTEEAVGLMDAGGVDAAVIHPPGWDPGATAMAFAAVRTYPGRFAIMGAFPLDRPENRALVASWRSQPGMLGLRYGFLQEPLRGWLEDGTLDWLWAAAERAGVPIAMLATDSLPAIGRIAERHPGLRLTIDHLGGKGGNTTLKDAAAMTHMPALLALAKYPNVAVKATGAPGYSNEAYPFPTMQTFVRQIYDAFGPQRMFWGTDITKMPCSWRQCVTMFTEELPWLSEQDKALIMGQAVCAWWGWDRSA
jgi:predicted TIM-barrel fold metal-dependent hydrolase